MNAPRCSIALLLLPAIVGLPAGGSKANAPTTQAATDRFGVLVRQLGDRDPVVRRAASKALAGEMEAARPALLEAMHSKRPQIAAAASELLQHAPWFTADDPPQVQRQLAIYGTLPPEPSSDPNAQMGSRSAVLRLLVTSGDRAFNKAAVRVSQLERSDNVVWLAFANASLDDTWEPFFERKDVGPLPPAMLIARARGIMAGRPRDSTQNSEAIALLQQAIEQERDRPTGTAAQLNWAVSVLVDQALAAGHAAAAADDLRLLIGRGETNGADGSNSDADEAVEPGNRVVDRLVQLQSRFGPLPGLDRDLALAGDDANDERALAIGVIAQRLSAATVARMMLAGATADIAGESDRDHATRLFEVGKTLIALGLPDVAQTVLEKSVAIDVPGLDKITDAYLRLCEIHSLAGDEQVAGDCLQRALDHLGAGDTLTVRRANGKKEVWPREEVQGRIAFLYLLAARKRNDTAETTKQALAVMESGTTESETFLDTLPTLEAKNPQIADPQAVSAFFDRVYAKAKQRLDANPGDAMEMNDIAWLCSRSGRRLDEALSLATRAVAARPDEAAYIDTLADATFRNGSPAEALALETRATAMLPDNTFMKEQVERFRKAAATTQP